MTTPIDPGNTEALAKIAYDNFTTLPGTIGDPATWEETARWPEERIPWTASASAVARAVCPEGYVVVRADDISAVIAFLWRRDLIMAGDWDVADRLRAALEDQP